MPNQFFGREADEVDWVSCASKSFEKHKVITKRG
jgi:hypothetical protein